MKTCMRTLVVFTAIAALFLISNLAFGEDSLYIDPSGNVGIGADPPRYKLDVAGDINTNRSMKIHAWPGYGDGYFRIWHDGDGGSGTPVGDQKVVFDVGDRTEVLSLENDGDVYVNKGNLTTNHYLYVHSWPNWGDGYFRIWHDGDGGNGTTAGEQRVFFDVGDQNRVLSLGNNGNVGIGTGSAIPTHTLEVIGDIHYTGLLTGGPLDPPYVLYTYETRQNVIDRVVKEVPPDKLDGAVLFFNGKISQMEILLPKMGEFRSLSGQLLESISPITKTFEVEDRYFLDRKTGKVDKYKVRKVPAEKYKIKENHVLDSRTGKFYKIISDEKGSEIDRFEVTKDQAVELVDLSVKDS